MARRATVIRAARAQAAPVLVLDAGNSLLTDDEGPEGEPGEVAAALIAQLGYDAVALGSGDLRALKPHDLARLRNQAPFALLSANARVAGEKELAAAPYTILTVASQRVALLGLTDTRAAPGWEVSDPLPAARMWARRLRGEADVLILLSHADQETNRAIAQRVPGIDLIIMGGSETLTEPLRLGRDGTLLLHAEGMAGANVGRAELRFDGRGRLLDYDWQRIRLNSAIVEDMPTQRWLLSLWDE